MDNNGLEVENIIPKEVEIFQEDGEFYLKYKGITNIYGEPHYVEIPRINLIGTICCDMVELPNICFNLYSDNDGATVEINSVSKCKQMEEHKLSSQND